MQAKGAKKSHVFNIIFICNRFYGNMEAFYYKRIAKWSSVFEKLSIKILYGSTIYREVNIVMGIYVCL